MEERQVKQGVVLAGGKRRSTTQRAFLSLASVVVLIASPARAVAASVALAFDLDYVSPINADASSGYDLGLRLGSQIHVPLVVITPELGFAYYGFSGDTALKVYRGVGGLRVGLGEIIRPGVFGHAGYGALTVDVGGHGQTSSSFTYDFGAFLDFTLLPIVNVGVHGAYSQLTGGDQPTFQFVTVGAQVTLVFQP